jgi:hypothetical protein
MKLSDKLRKLHEFLSDPEKWTQRAEARDFLGTATDPEGPDAVCFCPRGAAVHLFGPEGYRVTLAITYMLIDSGAWPDVPMWNDIKGRTHAEVLEVIEQTIKRVVAAEEFQEAMNA